MEKTFDPGKSFFHPCNPCKDYDPSKMLTHVKNILTRVTQATHIKIWPSQPAQPEWFSRLLITYSKAMET